MKSLKQSGAGEVCDKHSHVEVTDQRGGQGQIGRIRHHVFGGFAQIAPMPISPADLLSVPLSIAMGTHRCPEELFLASCWTMYPQKLRFQKVHPLESNPTHDVSIDEAFGSHRCPSHLFLAPSAVKELRALYARVFPERVETHDKIDLHEATGAYRCPVHLFVASQYKEEYYRRHDKINSDISQQKQRHKVITSGSGLTIYPEGEASIRIPTDHKTEVKKQSIVGRIARRCLKSIRRLSKK